MIELPERQVVERQVVERQVVERQTAPVAILMPSLAGGGAERILLEITRGLLARSVAVDVVVVRKEGALLESVPEGARLVGLSASRTLFAGKTFRRYLARERPIAVISALDPTNALNVIMTRLVRPRVPSIVTQHNTVSMVVANASSRWEHVVIAANRRLFAHASKIVAVSNGVADDLARTLHLDRDTIEVIYNPVISDRHGAATVDSAEHPWLRDKLGPVLLAAGRLVPAKGFADLVRALALLPDDHRLILLGEGEGRDELTQLARSLGVSDRIDIHGFVADPFPYFAAADVFVLSSHWEGLPTVLIEALPFRCGVVATDCPSGPREILEGGRWGTLVPCADPIALADGVRREIAHPHVRTHEAWSRYELDQSVDCYADLVTQLRARPTRPIAESPTEESPAGEGDGRGRRIRAIPWPVRMALKTVMTRLPMSYDMWRRLGVFRHGAMDDPAYAEGVVRMHLERSGIATAEGFRALELGPGDSVASAVVARALGAEHIYLVDVGAFASANLAPYVAVAEHLASAGLPAPDLSGITDIEGLCRACNATYLTNGLASLRTIPSASVDIVWSHAVLEHVHRDEMDATLSELARITKPDGVGSHCVDLRDHLDDALNNLRFSDERWESSLVYRSGLYTNRLQFRDYLRSFEAVGCSAEVSRVDRWTSLPTPRAKLAAPFRSVPDDELRVKGFDVVVRHRGDTECS